jgi:hypothetical protein
MSMVMEVIFTALVLLLTLLLPFAVWPILRQGHRLLVSSILPITHRRAEENWKSRKVEGPCFHVQRARPIGIFFSVLGIAGLCATWTFATSWDVRTI